MDDAHAADAARQGMLALVTRYGEREAQSLARHAHVVGDYLAATAEGQALLAELEDAGLANHPLVIRLCALLVRAVGPAVEQAYFARELEAYWEARRAHIDTE